MTTLIEQFKQQLEALPATRRWLVAFSGGLDSTVLLHLLAAARPQDDIVAVHVNHQLSEFADQWQGHCQQVCAQLGVSFEGHKVHVRSSGFGLEDAARTARYQVFESLIEPGDVLLMGHHLDDQAETLMLRLMRGSGVRGLSAIRATRALAGGELLRPLLNHHRAELEEYAEANKLEWVEDDSNQSSEFDRNYLRLSVMPQLEARWKGFAERWQQSAELMRDSDELLTDLAAEDLNNAGFRVEHLGSSVDLKALKALRRSRRNNVLRHWAELQKGAIPDQKHLLEIEAQCLNGRVDAKAQVQWGRVQCSVHRDRLHLFPLLTESPQTLSWDGRAPLQWGDWLLDLEQADSGFKLPALGFEVTLRQTGERCHPEGRKHSQTLKKLLNEYQLPAWLRQHAPFLRVGGELVAAADLWVCQPYLQHKTETSEPLYRLRWRYRPV